MKRTFYGRHQFLDPGCVGTQEIEITSLTIDITPGDQRASTGESKELCFRKLANDRRNPTLERR